MGSTYGSSSFARPPAFPSQQYQYQSPDGTTKWKGPRRVFLFCSLAVVLPSLLISIPLYLRFVVYGTNVYVVHPSDMMLLDKRISTSFCQGESIKVNTTFTAYVTSGELSMLETPTMISIGKQMKIPDDQKEYWGLYLYPGSVLRIRACAKFKGGTLLLVRGYQRMNYCAYVGEGDSAGNSDEISGSMSVEATANGKGRQMTGLENVRNGDANIFSRLKNYLESHPSSRDQIQKTLEEWMFINGTVKPPNTAKNISNNLNKINQTDKEGFQTSSSSHDLGTVSDVKFQPESSTIEHGILTRRRRKIDTESNENGAYEDNSIMGNDDLLLSIDNINSSSQEYKSLQNRTSSIWKLKHDHNQHSGVFNDTVDGNDGSDSESESSFSSSEEALLKCEGIIASLKVPYDEQKCTNEFLLEDRNFLPNQTDLGSNLFELKVQEQDYYYVIFGSENEKEINLIRSMYELEKVEYRLPEPIENCTDVDECQISFSFASSEKVVIKLPQPDPNATSNVIYVAETECKPRTHLYMIFIILVPIVILMFAFK